MQERRKGKDWIVSDRNKFGKVKLKQNKGFFFFAGKQYISAV